MEFHIAVGKRDRGESEIKMSGEALRDKVAIIGMGCTNFGVLHNLSYQDQAVIAVNEALSRSNTLRTRFLPGLNGPSLAPGQQSRATDTDVLTGC